MSEQIKAKNSEEIKTLKKRLDDLEVAVKAILVGIKQIEVDDIEENRVPNGTYLGVDFPNNRTDW